MIRRLGLLLALLFAAASPAAAQNVFQTPAGPGVTVIGTVAMCLNSIGKAVPTDQNGACPGGGSSFSGAVFGPDAVGISATKPPVLLGGTSDGSATGSVGVLKVAGGLAFINCANCSGSGASAVDGATFVPSTSIFAPGGGFFQTTATNNPLANLQQGLFQMTAQRAIFVNPRNSSGVEIATASNPYRVDPTGTTTQPVSGTVAVSNFPATQPVSGTVTANQGTSPWVVSLTSTTVTGTVAVTQSTIPWTVAGAAASGAAKSGNPVQVGGVFNTTQPTVTTGQAVELQASARGAMIVATGVDGFAVTNAGTFAVQLTGATNNINNIAGTVSLPTGAATSTNQTNASQKTQIVDGAGNVIASTSNNLNVQCANCSGSGASAADAATFTAGTSTFAPAGGQFTSGGATACVTGHQCLVGITAARAFLTDVSSIAGTATLTGNGTSGAGAQRVVIASDNTAFSVNATLQASASTAIGKVDPNTIGSWGLQVSTQNSATPTNGGLVLGQFNTSPTTITTGNVSPLQLDSAANLKVNVVTATGLAQGSTTSGQTGNLVMGAVTTAAPSYTTAQTSPISLTTAGAIRVDGSGVTQPVSLTSTTISGTVAVTQSTSPWVVAGAAASGASKSGNPVQVGAVFNTTQPTVTTGQAVEAQATARGAIIVATGTDTFSVTCANCSGSGASAVDAATFTAGTSVFAPSGGQFTSGGATACVTGHQCMSGMTAARAMFQDLSSIAGTTTLTGNGTAGAGAQRVTIASDNTAFSVNATLSAETTKVIGTIRIVGNVGGVLDAIGQNVAAPANWLQAGCQFNTSPTTITSGNGSPFQCDASGNLKVVGTGIAIGSTTSGQTGSLVMGAVTTSPPTYTTAQSNPLSLTTAGGLRVDNASLAGTALGAPSNYGTSPGAVAVQGVNAFITNSPAVVGGTVASTAMQSAAVANGNGTSLTVTNYATALVNVNCSVACSGGTTINFEGTDSTGTFFSVAAYPIAGGASVNTATTSGQFLIPATGLTSLRARISAYSAGTITVTGTPFYGNFPANPVSAAGGTSSSFAAAFPATGTAIGVKNGANMVNLTADASNNLNVTVATALPAGTNLMGKVGIDQTTPGTTNGTQDASTGSTGAAAPSKAAYIGTLQSGATGGQLKGEITCDSHIFKHVTTATDTLVVQGVASQTIRICGVLANFSGSAAQTIFLENTASANANCSSANTQIGGAIVGNSTAPLSTGFHNSIWSGFSNTSGNGLCLNSTGTGGVDIDVWYTQF